jgi:hypothetical protein
MEFDMKVISWSEAKATGAKRYFTGNACKHGHVSERFTCNRECVACDAERKVRRKTKVEVKVEVVNSKEVRVVRFRVVGRDRRFNKFRPQIIEDKIVAVG